LFLNASVVPDIRYAAKIRDLWERGKPFVATAGDRVSAALVPAGGCPAGFPGRRGREPVAAGDAASPARRGAVPDARPPVEVVKFLRSILPRKRVSELFTVLGRAKQGKTERYRELYGHLQQSDDQFVLAPGEKGLVMVCFTLPSFDVVFKLIRDKFPYQKNILREDVLYTDRQEAFVHRYYITRSELAHRLYSHPKREKIMSRITEAKHQPGTVAYSVHLMLDQ
jgi:hypothetical protein